MVGHTRSLLITLAGAEEDKAGLRALHDLLLLQRQLTGLPQDQLVGFTLSPLVIPL